MRALLAFYLAGFRRWSAYRSATAAGAFTNSAFGFTKASISVAAVVSAGGAIGGYDVTQVATYAWLSQAMIGPVSLFGWTELADRIRTGDVATDLTRPADLQLSWLAADLGRATFVTIPRGLPPVVVGALTFGLAMPASALPYVLGLLSVVLAIGISFACRFLLNLVAFWLLDIRGAMSLYLVASNVLAGMIVPVHWFPGWLLTVAHLTPFPSMLQAPLDVLMGRDAGSEALQTLAVQGIWLVGILLAGRVVLTRATRKLVVQGG